jgi:hypothetical protein
LKFTRIHPQIGWADYRRPFAQALREDRKAMRFPLSGATVGTPLVDETERRCTNPPPRHHDITRIGMPAKSLHILAHMFKERVLLPKE